VNNRMGYFWQNRYCCDAFFQS